MKSPMLSLLLGLALCGAPTACSEPPDPPPSEGAGAPAASVNEADTAAVPNLEHLKRLWREERYAEVLPGLLRYRKTQSYGKNEIVDYMIGTSACRIPEKQSNGYQFLTWMLQHYPLDERSRQRVEAERDGCRATADGGLVPVMLATQNLAVSGAGVSGKMFYDITRGEDLPLSNAPVEVVRDIPPDTLAARRFARSQSTAALAALQQRVGPRFAVTHTPAFLLASTTHGPEGLANVGDALEQLLHFYISTYDLPPPDYFITVYLTPSVGEMRELAEQIHGLRLARRSIGYSMRDDLSMVGVVPGQVYGTLAHELFHLMVRRDFGDIPPWLDEGMAALYEVARSTPEGVRGLPNWRGRVLQTFWAARPSVEELVRMDWRGFEDAVNEYDVEQQMANHAMARYFMLFLQERDQLAAVFEAFHQRPVTAQGTDPADDAVRRLASVLGQPLDEIDRAFVTWFRQVHP